MKPYEIDRDLLMRATFLKERMPAEVEWRERLRWYRGLHILDQFYDGAQWTPEQIAAAKAR